MKLMEGLQKEVGRVSSCDCFTRGDWLVERASSTVHCENCGSSWEWDGEEWQFAGDWNDD